MRINVEIAEECIAQGTLKKYAVWLFLKNNYRNSCYYKYNCNRLHKISGLSRTSIKKYISFFLENEWCRMHKGNLTFIAVKHLRKLVGAYYFRRTEIKGASIKGLVDDLRYAILQNKDANFRFLKKMSSDLINPSGEQPLRDLKKAKSFFKKSGALPVPECPETASLKISLITLGGLIGCSPATAHALIKTKAQNGLATIIKEPFKKVRGCNGPLPGNMFYANGFVYTPTCNKYLFL